MFNLKSQKKDNETDLLWLELKAFNIIPNQSEYQIQIGDENLSLPTLQECYESISSAKKELLQHLKESWNNLLEIGTRILKKTGRNSGSINNLLFLNAVKKTYLFCNVFQELHDHKNVIEQLLDSDILSADDHLVNSFVHEYITIHSLHRLILNEVYRQKLIRRISILTKKAQISGPWANLDLPMQERKWSWDEGEDEYFKNRSDAKKSQVRYNPEEAGGSVNPKTGFYYVWQELRNAPYLFDDREDESPYPGRNSLFVA